MTHGKVTRRGEGDEGRGGRVRGGDHSRTQVAWGELRYIDCGWNMVASGARRWKITGRDA